MPRYTIRDPTTNRTVTIEGPSPPTEAELETIFTTVNAQGGAPRVPPTTTSVGLGPFRHDVPTASLPTDIQASLQTPTPPGHGDIVLQNAKNLTDTGINALPAIGGAVAGGLGSSVGGPVGAIAGASVGGAAGESVKQAIDAARGRPVPATVGARTIADATQAAIQGGAEGVGQAVTALAPAAAQAVYRGYLKPSLSQRLLPKADAIVQTALDEALPISRGGAQQAQGVITDLRGQVDRILANTPGTIDLHDVADQVRTFAKTKYFKPGVPAADYDAALAVADSLDRHASIGLPAGATPTRVDVSLPAANETKRGLYTAIQDAGFGTPTGATKTTQKFAASTIKTGLEDATGGITGDVAVLNARESKLIDAAKAINRAVQREANQNVLTGGKSLTSAALGTAGVVGGMTGGTAAVGSVAARGAMHPAIVSRAAILANRLSSELGVSASLATRLAGYVLSQDGQDEQSAGP